MTRGEWRHMRRAAFANALPIFKVAGVILAMWVAVVIWGIITWPRF